MEEQSKIIAELPNKPGEALKALMKLSGNATIEQMAERAGVGRHSQNWRKEEYNYDPETVIRIIVGLHLPPWISSWLLQICGVALQFRGLHMMDRRIISCHTWTPWKRSTPRLSSLASSDERDLITALPIIGS